LRHPRPIFPHLYRLDTGRGTPGQSPPRDGRSQVEPGYAKLLQQGIGRRLTLIHDGHQHVGAVGLVASGRAHLQHGPLDDPLKGGGGLGLDTRNALELPQRLLQQNPQVPQIHFARLQDPAGVGVVEQGQQQVLEAGVLVPPLEGNFQRTANRTFEGGGQRSLHTCILESSRMMGSDCAVRDSKSCPEASARLVSGMTTAFSAVGLGKGLAPFGKRQIGQPQGAQAVHKPDAAKAINQARGQQQA